MDALLGHVPFSAFLFLVFVVDGRFGSLALASTIEGIGYDQNKTWRSNARA